MGLNGAESVAEVACEPYLYRTAKHDAFHFRFSGTTLRSGEIGFAAFWKGVCKMESPRFSRKAA